MSMDHNWMCCRCIAPPWLLVSVVAWPKCKHPCCVCMCSRTHAYMRKWHPDDAIQCVLTCLSLSTRSWQLYVSTPGCRLVHTICTYAASSKAQTKTIYIYIFICIHTYIYVYIYIHIYMWILCDIYSVAHIITHSYQTPLGRCMDGWTAGGRMTNGQRWQNRQWPIETARVFDRKGDPEFSHYIAEVTETTCQSKQQTARESWVNKVANRSLCISCMRVMF